MCQLAKGEQNSPQQPKTNLKSSKNIFLYSPLPATQPFTGHSTCNLSYAYPSSSALPPCRLFAFFFFPWGKYQVFKVSFKTLVLPSQSIRVHQGEMLVCLIAEAQTGASVSLDQLCFQNSEQQDNDFVFQ